MGEVDFYWSGNTGVCVMDLNTLIFAIVLVVMGGLFGTMYLQSIPKSSKHLRQKNSDLEDLNTYNKKQLTSLRAKVNSDHALPKVSGDMSDIDSIITSLLPKITSKFPELKGLIGDGDISTIIKLAKDHPEIVKKFLPKFLSTGKKNDDIEGTNSLSV